MYKIAVIGRGLIGSAADGGIIEHLPVNIPDESHTNPRSPVRTPKNDIRNNKYIQ